MSRIICGKDLSGKKPGGFLPHHAQKGPHRCGPFLMLVWILSGLRPSRMTVDTLNLKKIIVYDVCKTDGKALAIFEYAIQKGVEIVIPDNILKKRNRADKKTLKGDSHESTK